MSRLALSVSDGKKSIGCYKFLNSPILSRHVLGFEPALSPYMHSPIHFAFVPILPSCFTLLGTFRICYETNAKRKFDSARNRFVENRFQVSQVVMQMCMATTNTAADAGSLAYGFLHAHVHGSWNQGKMCTLQNMCTYPNKCVPDGFGACHE